MAQRFRFVPVSVGGGLQSYSTSFATTESPISESGQWSKLDSYYQAINVSGGNAIPASISGAGNGPGSGPYDDCVAFKTGTWAPDIRLTAVVYRGSADNGEVELNVRGSQSASLVTGVECTFNIDGSVAIVRWDGHDNWTPLDPGTWSIPSGLSDGDVVRTQVVGNTYSMYYARAATPTTFNLIGSLTQSVFATGNPWIGFFKRGSGVSTPGDLNFGFKSIVIEEI